MTHRKTRIRRLQWRIMLVVLAFGSTALVACQVPVFRFALERWQTDPLRLVVLHRGEETAAQQAAVKDLLGLSQTGFSVEIRQTAITDDSPEMLREIYGVAGVSAGPVVAAFYPPNSSISPGTPACVLPVNEETRQTILNSPIRKQLVNRLIRGDSAVWLLLECGQQGADDQAAELLQSQFLQLQTRLLLPDAETLQIEPERLSRLRVPFQLKFSMLRIARTDPKERLLVNSLLNSEPDLRELREPIAFPVFGRGRVLYALAGNGINSSTIEAVCEFLTGPCSCQVKEENPGFDLPLHCDWTAKLGKDLLSSPVPERNQPPVLLKIPAGRRRNDDQSGGK